MSSTYQTLTVGIVGGGQLGRMLVQAGIDFNVKFAILDPDPQAPCHQLGQFTVGKLTDFDAVVNFAAGCDVVTIEIENVNTQALKALQQQGKKVFPQPDVIELIQDKRQQKQFYQKHRIPTADFVLVNSRQEVLQHAEFLPAVNKLGKEGYDGRGVQVIKTGNDLSKAFDAPGLLEKFVPFEKEIAVIVARNEQGEICSYPPVEMVFHPEKNLVEYLFAPARLDKKVEQEADQVARKVIESLAMVGLLAVEMFVTREGKVLVNEIAPRPHNSGHHTIEASVTSQYEQHLRAILNLPFGDTTTTKSAMVNILGAEGFEGKATYEGMDQVLKLNGVHVHLYGKFITKPYRKMGHATIVDSDEESLKKKAKFVKDHLKVIA